MPGKDILTSTILTSTNRATGLFVLVTPVNIYILFTESPKGAGGESSSLDEDSSDALSPDQLTNHDSPLSAVPQMSPCDTITQNGNISPTQVPRRMYLIQEGSII